MVVQLVASSQWRLRPALTIMVGILLFMASHGTARAASWQVVVTNSSDAKDAATLAGGSSIYKPGSKQNPYLVCKGTQVTITWAGQVTGTPPSHSECNVSGPTWSWAGAVSGSDTASVSQTFTFTSGGMKTETETATVKYTFSPKQNAPPDHNCPAPATEDASNTVYISVSDASNLTWRDYHSASLKWPPQPANQAYDTHYVEPGRDPAGNLYREHQKGTITVAKAHRVNPWKTADCGQKLESDSSTQYSWSTTASVDINAYGIASFGTGLSTNVATTQTKGYSFGGTEGVEFQWCLLVPQWKYTDVPGTWTYQISTDNGQTWGAEQPTVAPSPHVLHIQDLDSAGADFAKEWQCCAN